MSRRGLTKDNLPARIGPVADSSQALEDKKSSDLVVGERRWVVYNCDKSSPVFSISLRDKIIVDTWIETQSIVDCAREIAKQLPASAQPSNVDAISKLLKKPFIAEYIAQELVARGKVNWYSREKWLADGVDMAHKGKGNTVKVMAWKAYGEAKWPNEKNPLLQFNQQIQFVQEDGRA